MTDSPSQRDRYLELIDQIVQMTLKGKIRSKEQVHRMLRQNISQGHGEIFERCLGDRFSGLQRQLEIQTDELKLAKTNRSLRALQTIQGQWERWQQQNQSADAIAATVQQIVAADPTQRLTALTRALDPNQKQALGSDQLKQLAQALAQQATTSLDPKTREELQQLSRGIQQGLETWKPLETHLVSWMYEQGQGQLGFAGAPGQQGPWSVWSKQISSVLPRLLFQSLARNQSVAELVVTELPLELIAWVELIAVLRYLQQGLVNWFDKLVYDSKVGAKLSIATFLTFAIVWSQLANGLAQTERGDRQDNQCLAKACFQIALQILRTFAQRDYFPLYGGIFASFSGDYLRDALNYLDEPLQEAEGTQEKARILTLLGTSRCVLGDYSGAIALHQQALKIAQTAGDRPCEIANFNHLSRTQVAQKNYAAAIDHSQRALILSRQAGDRLGEANALANLGYSQVFQNQQGQDSAPAIETAIAYLQQGLQLTERLGDRQSQALCLSSLGVAHIVLDRFVQAVPYLEGGLQAAQFSGDLYLQGLNRSYLATAHYALQNWAQAIVQGCLGMYLLEQISAAEWRQPAGLLLVLQGQQGAPAFQEILEQHRSKILMIIGIDGYDHLPKLLEEYRHSLE